MTLKMQCQHCSEFKAVESQDDSTAACLEAAAKAFWFAQYVSSRRMIIFWCSGMCEHKYRLRTKTHLTIVGSVSR